MLAIEHALNDDLLDNDLHREIAAAAKMNDFAHLEVLSARCDQDIDNRAKTFHAFLSSRVTGPGDSPFLEDHPDMQRRAAADSVDRYFPVEAVAADRKRTRQTNNFLLFFLLISFFFPFVTFNGCLLFLCSYIVSMFQIVF